MNLYVDLTAFKDRIGHKGTGEDSLIEAMLMATSRAIDNYCGRTFFVETETRYFDGAGLTLMLDRDLLSVTSLKTDDNDDGTYETAWAAADYLTIPYTDKPYAALTVDRRSTGSKADFNNGVQRGIEIAGDWGYNDESDDSGADINEGGSFSSSDTTLTVTDGSKFAVGQTIKIESEQLYISAISTNDLTVTRGVNGSTAAAHADSTDIDIYRYPRPVVEGTLIQGLRRWRSRDPAFAARRRLPGWDDIPSVGGLDEDVRFLLGSVRRTEVIAI